MQGKAILLKIVVALTAISVHVRVSLPRYSVVVQYGTHGVSVTLARVVPQKEPFEVRVEPGREASGVAESRVAPALRPTSENSRQGQASTVAPEASAAKTAASAETAGSGHRDARSQKKAAIEFMNIAPEGTSVLAGKAEPGSRVTVFENGLAVGDAVAGPEGDWSLATGHRFASKDPSQSLSVTSAPQAGSRDVTAAGEALQSKGEPRAAHDGAAREAASTAVPGTEEARPVQRPAERVLQQFAETVAAARRAGAGVAPSPAPPEAQSAETETAARDAPAPASVSEGIASPQVAQPPAGPIAAAEGTPQEETPARRTGPPAQPVRAEAAPAPTIIPIPMQFVFREATLTGDGEKAVALLLEYLKLKKYDDVTLSGHADERGSAEFNMALSRDRLDTVVRRLREGGYRGKVELLPKGKSEPFAGIDRTRFEREDLMQLDRRVELRVAR